MPLDGRKASEVMEAAARPSYTLTVARPQAKLATDEEELPVGEHAGWLHVTRARLLFVGGLTASRCTCMCMGRERGMVHGQGHVQGQGEGHGSWAGAGAWFMVQGQGHAASSWVGS